jgi:hypothetical protein
MRQIGTLAGYDEYYTKMAFGGHKTGAAISNKLNPRQAEKLRRFFVGITAHSARYISINIGTSPTAP